MEIPVVVTTRRETISESSSESSYSESMSEPDIMKSSDVQKEKDSKTSTSESVDEKPSKDIDTVITPIIEKESPSESSEEEPTSVHSEIPQESELKPEGKTKEEVLSSHGISKEREFPSSSSEAGEPKPEVEIPVLKIPEIQTKLESSSSSLESKVEVESKEEVPLPAVKVTKELESEYKREGSCNMTPKVEVVTIPGKEITSESSFSQSKSEPDPMKSPDVEKEKDTKTFISVSEDDKPSKGIDTVITPIVEKETSEKETTNVHSEIPLQTEVEPEEKPKQEIPPIPEFEVEEPKTAVGIPVVETSQKETKSESSSSSSQSKAEMDPREDHTRNKTDTSVKNHARKKQSTDQQVKTSYNNFGIKVHFTAILIPRLGHAPFKQT